MIAAATGVLPFGSIFIEMYFIFTSFWNYKYAPLPLSSQQKPDIAGRPKAPGVSISILTLPASRVLHRFYFVYGFMLLVYLILMIVSVCTTIVATYFVLNAENYHWQWIAFLSSGSTAVYVFLYSIYYFLWKTKMSGLLQLAFYFGYM